MSDAAPPTTSHPKPASDWSYPTGSYGSYPYTYSGSYHYDPQATEHPESFGSTKGSTSGGPASMTRGANYFFGFLVTFIVVLLFFVACGVGSRRRAASRRRRERMDELVSGGPPYGPSAITFRGLLAATGSAHARREREARNASNDELMKKKPTYHEVWLAPVDEKQLSYDDRNREDESVASSVRREGTEAWFAIEPLSATVVRTPKDFQPYQHFHDVNLASSSAHIRNDSRTTTGMSPLIPQSATDRDSLPPYEAVDTRGPWYNHILPTWSASSRSNAETVGHRVSMITFPRPDIEVAPGRAYREKPQTRSLTGDTGAPGEVDESLTRKNVEVAVMVVMPSEANRRLPGLTSIEKAGSSSSLGRPHPIPECQIGVATARMANAD